MDLPQSLTLADKTGLIQAVKGTLISHPDPAAADLATALAKLRAIFSVMLETLNEYEALRFDDKQDISDRMQERSVLVKLGSGTHSIELLEITPQCHKIKNLYTDSLKPWFENALNPFEQGLMKSLFEDLGTADDEFERDMNKLAMWVSRQARDTLARVDAGEFQEANQLINDAREANRPLQEAIMDAIRRLYHYESEFLSMRADLPR
jgi:hypothetical protein